MVRWSVRGGRRPNECAGTLEKRDGAALEGVFDPHPFLSWPPGANPLANVRIGGAGPELMVATKRGRSARLAGDLGRHQHGRVFLGEDLLSWLVLAIGGAMAVGNVAALVRPPDERRDDDDLERAPMARSIVFIVIGALAALWALASLISG